MRIREYLVVGGSHLPGATIAEVGTIQVAWAILIKRRLGL